MNLDAKRAAELLELAERLDFKIKDFALLNQALTHASVFAETKEIEQDYESLEFIGDAVLGLAVAHWLYQRVPDRTPGEYSRMRAGVVNRRSLARVARALSVGPHIRLGKGEDMAGGRDRAALLADCLEAIFGALYIDQGWETAREFIIRVLGDELEREVVSDRAWDFKSRLQNYCQARHLGLPVFNVVKSQGPDHRKEFEVEVVVQGKVAGNGRGLTKKDAEQNAARMAYEQVEK